MRKKIIDQNSQEDFPDVGIGLDLSRLAEIEITSEDTAHPIENALTTNECAGWRAANKGKQTIRIIFDELQRINNIQLLFEEKKQQRTQEFNVRWSSGIDHPFQEIVRQQYNFCPGASTAERENYTVNLDGVKVVELKIVPDIDGTNAYATISYLAFT